MSNDIVVVASSPKELEVAQEQLILWAGANLEESRVDLADVQKNFEISQRNKWRSGPWKRRIPRLKRLVDYYEKIKAALEAGYYIVPDFPIDVFAIRTSKKKPRKYTAHSRYTWELRIQDQKTNSPPLGEGRFVDPATIDETWETKKKKSDGETETVYHAMADEFDAPQFPMVAVKPQIMEDTSRAMLLKMFDEIGILPERRNKNSDPMVIGRVVLREGYSEKSISFLLSWWFDSRQF